MPAAEPGNATSDAMGVADGGSAASPPADSRIAPLRNEAARLRSRFTEAPMGYVYLLMAVTAIDQADRTILALVFDDVKAAFGVSDSALGILVGAFSLVASFSVVPFGFLADRWSRVKLIALGFVPWGLAMLAQGAAASFGMMFVARMFLGTIEATNGPATPSLIGDYYRKDNRNKAMGIFQLGTLLGSLSGFALAGVVASQFGWRATFFVWGAAGFLAGALVFKLLPEPERGLADAVERAEFRLWEAEHPVEAESRREARQRRVRQEGNGDERAPTEFDYRTIGITDAAREIVRVRTMWIMYIAAAVGDFVFSGLATWAVSFFRRYHDFGQAAAGAVTALMALGVVGGVLAGARLGHRLVARDQPERRVLLAAVAFVVGGALLIPAFALDSLLIVTPLFLAAGVALGIPQAPLRAIELDVMIPHLRGRAQIVRSVLRAGALALAPILLGVLSDQFSLRAAIIMLTPIMFVNSILLVPAARSYHRDHTFAEEESLRQVTLEDA